MVMIVVAIAALVGIVALVIDVGSWFRAQRQLQTAADAAALAGVQEMPNQSSASSLATSYANTNAAGATKVITFPTSGAGNCPAGTGSTDTVNVCLSKPAQGVFSKLYGLASITVHAHARARVGSPGSLKNVAPVAVLNTTACTDASTGCFNTTKVMTFDESSLSSSAFGLVDLNKRASTAVGAGCKSGRSGASEFVTWIQTGYPAFLDINLWYCAGVGEKIGPIRDAFEAQASAQTVLLFPAFDSADNVISPST